MHDFHAKATQLLDDFVDPDEGWSAQSRTTARFVLNALPSCVPMARVKNGRLVLDEPTDLPEDSVVPLRIADDWDEMDEEQRAALHHELTVSILERKAGAPTFSIEEVLAELGSRR